MLSLIESWKAEKLSAWLYLRVAEAEENDAISGLFVRLSTAAEEQAEILATKVSQDGGSLPAFYPTARARLAAYLASTLGPRRVRPLLAALKIRGLSAYSNAAPLLEHPMPTSVAEIGRRHTRTGGAMNLRAAVFGVNDGLVSNTSLIMGVAGATSDTTLVMLSGTAGLLAGAFSMAAGEYVSVRSQRDLYEHQIAQERAELEHYPEEEAEELALIYAARGLPIDQARKMTAALFKNPEQALRCLALEELGVNPDELGSPWAAAASSFLSFAVGAALPLAPFAAGAGQASLAWAALVSALGLFMVGAAVSLFSGKSALGGGLRMLAIGTAAGVSTYLLGSWLGVTLG
ncbi:MAG: VIT1/CCC1 transporter family protein [Deltaproteobacteria bacterium]